MEKRQLVRCRFQTWSRTANSLDFLRAESNWGRSALSTRQSALRLVASAERLPLESRRGCTSGVEGFGHSDFANGAAIPNRDAGTCI